MEILADELLKKIQELEMGHAQLKQEMSKRILADVSGMRLLDRGLSRSVSPLQVRPPMQKRNSGGPGVDVPAWRRSLGSFGLSPGLHRESPGTIGSSISLSERQYLNILQSMGQSVHIFDLEGTIIYWNRSAENLYGYSASEALGKHGFGLLIDTYDCNVASNILQRIVMGESWTGKFPVKNKLGERFVAIASNTPFYDDNSSLIGIIIVSSDLRSFQDDTPPPSPSAKSQASKWNNAGVVNEHGSDPQQPIQVAIASKITNLAGKVASKVRSRIKPGEHNRERVNRATDHQCPDLAVDHEDGGSSEFSTPKDDVLCTFGTQSDTVQEKSPAKTSKVNRYEDEGKASIFKIISKTEALLVNKRISWPWKGHEHEHEHDDNETKNHFSWPWLHGDQENDSHNPKSSESGRKVENQVTENKSTGSNDVSVPCSSHNVNSMSSSGSTMSSNGVQRVDVDADCLDYEILWEDLIIGEQIGQGSCGTVYHALWYGSDIAVKVFSKQEYSDEVILSFREEVSLMKRLRHPNILLFMGAVTSPKCLCIVTEFLPRGSLYRLLQRNTTRLDWRRRILMALDIAKGMNYLHRCNPPIVHRDLKSSNLLVDKNWTVKVGDFGLSRLKYETYLITKSGKGTPQWMAPEVLRNEPSDEKSDVYGYGVILWELATEKIPWYNLNSMQVIAAVGFMNQRLEIPKDLDLRWVSIIESCWLEPKLRPTFQELIERLKELQRHHSAQSHPPHPASRDISHSSPKDISQDWNEVE